MKALQQERLKRLVKFLENLEDDRFNEAEDDWISFRGLDEPYKGENPKWALTRGTASGDVASWITVLFPDDWEFYEELPWPNHWRPHYKHSKEGRLISEDLSEFFGGSYIFWSGILFNNTIDKQETINEIKTLVEDDSAIKEMSKPIPCNLPCEKCGNEDIYRKFFKEGENVLDRGKQSSEFVDRGNNWKWPAKKDCIVHTCRCCGHSWDSETL